MNVTPKEKESELTEQWESYTKKRLELIERKIAELEKEKSEYINKKLPMIENEKEKLVSEMNQQTITRINGNIDRLRV